jgi:glycosidase
MPNPGDLLTNPRPTTTAEVRELADRARREGISYFPSPVDWRDEVLYFLLPDRFSDGKESTRPLLTRAEIRSLRSAPSRADIDWRAWARSGLRWQGGTIRGVESKLDYLADLGITAIWLGPVFKQRTRLDTFHGYGVQDFLDVDPRFGTRADLIALVTAAHAKGIRIVLDVIFNHSGDNWGYVPPARPLSEEVGQPGFRAFPDFYGNPNHPETRGFRLAWRNELGVCFTDDGDGIVSADDGVWPRDLRHPAAYTRAGMGNLGESDVGNPHAEHKRTDFFALKDFALDAGDTLSIVADCFKYWILLTDCDGFRLDTVKHVSLEEARNFCGAIREFADSIGKRRFLLVGEIAGGDGFQDFVLDHLSLLQRNLDAALDIGSARLNLQGAGKGLIPASAYLEGFKAASQGFESHRSFGDRHVSILDDHDHVAGDKVRFSAEIPDDAAVKDHQVVAATALQLFTLGIPCVYYGSEQAFAGPAQSQLRFLLSEGWKDGGNHGDRYLREAMFGPAHPRADFRKDLATQLADVDPSLPGFGPFGTFGKHCFDEKSPAYVRIRELCRVRREEPALRIGRQYARQTRVLSPAFALPAAGELVAWSRILDRQEAVCAVNPNGQDGAFRGADVVVAAELWPPGTVFVVRANTAETAAAAEGVVFAGSHRVGSFVEVKRPSAGGPAFIEIRNVPPGEVVVLVKRV